jgi:iron complex outermembrane receptor protein
VRQKKIQNRSITALATLVLLAVSAGAQAPSPTPDLTVMSIEDLMNVEVTSVSKKEQKLSQAAAAVYVITQDDIRRSGATNIPDVLRMAPGVDVAQIDGHIWAISIRGFGDRFTDKVLVLIDGRSVYTPTSSGVNWDQQNVPLEDIERIEVIRGPGGTVWGANAVNGVINIITKSAKATHGGLVTAAAGTNGNAQGLIQYGGVIGPKGSYRVFGNYVNTGNTTAADGTPAPDNWHTSQGGFRTDWDLSRRDALTVQGDLMGIHAGETDNVTFFNALPLQATVNSKTTVAAGNILGRWIRTLSPRSDISLQAYYDAYNRYDEGGLERRKTFDLDFHHHFAAGSRHDIVWGLGYRVTSDDLAPQFAVMYTPQQRTDHLFSAFIQDEIKLTNSLWLTLGSKIEHNGYTGREFEPSSQLVWTPTKRQTIWISVARAIRQPARSDTDIQIAAAAFPVDNGNFALLELFGDPQREAERLLAYQVGYRAQVNKRLSFDVAGFSNFYSNVQTTESGDSFFSATPGPPHLVIPLTFNEEAHAWTYGGEVFANWNVTKRWRISPGYAFIHLEARPDPNSNDATVTQLGGSTPHHKFEIRSLLNLPHNLDLDSAFYHVGSLPTSGVSSYDRFDSRLGWRAGEHTEFSIVGQNLLTPRHTESQDAFGLNHTQVKRSVYGKITWRF